MLADLFAELTAQAGGNPLALHAGLTECFPAMPPEMRTAVVAYSVERSEPLHADLACFWLLNPSPELRLAAAQGLGARLANGVLSGSTHSKLVVLRSWMPADAARHVIDALLKDALRRGVQTDAEHSPWKITEVRSSLPDGSGAQSIAVALQHGSKRKLAMLLLKQGYGVKDAYTISCRTAAKLKSLLARMTEEVGAMKVSSSYVEGVIADALADGLHHGQPPVPGLIDLAQLCGFFALRPETSSTADLLVRLPVAAALSTSSPKARAELIASSDELWERLDFMDSWFEDSDAAQDLLSKARNTKAAETALWKWLETRCDWWARIFARTAEVFGAANDDDAAAFAACAVALLEGANLKKIPLMGDVHTQTMQAWEERDGDHDPDLSLEELPTEAPLPEKKASSSATWRVPRFLSTGWKAI